VKKQQASLPAADQPLKADPVVASNGYGAAGNDLPPHSVAQPVLAESYTAKPWSRQVNVAENAPASNSSSGN